MEWLREIETVDAVALGVLALACLRGLWIGAVREAFSLAALAAAVLAVRLWTGAGAEWLAAETTLSLATAKWVAGAALGVGAILGVAGVGRLVRRGLRAAGLGAFDRLAGGLLGIAEGGLVLALFLTLATSWFGPSPRFLQGTRTLAFYQDARRLVDDERSVDVAAPPRGWSARP
jgi:membrane protein required for colicin V production